MICLIGLLLGVMLAFYEAPLLLWTGYFLVVLIVATVMGVHSGWLVFLWGLFALFAAVINIPGLRMRGLSGPLYRLFCTILPPMSVTEKEAIDAGSVGWEKTLFSGKPDWSALYTRKIPVLNKEERAFLDNEVNHVCGMIDDWAVTHKNLDLPQVVWEYLKEKGFFGLIIPKEFGGKGFSSLAHSDVVVKIASRSISAAVTVMVPNSLGPAELILGYGTQQQKEYYLPRLAKGEEIPCFALTGPRAGSDAGAIPDSGVVCRKQVNGQEVLGVKINCNKRYITLAPVATLVGLAFHLYDPDHLLGQEEDLGITLALIPRDTQGMTLGRRHFPVNMAFMNGPVQGKDVFVDMDAIIGGVAGVGKGWRMLMECLGAGRAISLPSLSVAASKLMSRTTGGYAAIRDQFHHALGDFEGVKAMLAEMAGSAYVMEATRALALAEINAIKRPSVVSAIAKYNLTEKMRKVVNHAMDVQGGSGICLGPKNIWGRIYQSIPVAITVEGANILTRSMIIFGQGAMRCHPYLLDEMQYCQMEDQNKGLHGFDDVLQKHVRYFIRNMIRSWVLGLVSPLYCLFKSDVVSRAEAGINRLSASFAFMADLLFMLYGGRLKIKEHLSGRMADVFSELYMAAAALKRYKAANAGMKKDELILLQWSLASSLEKGRQAMHEIIRNLPNVWIRGLVFFIVFPVGRTAMMPDDRLTNAVADVLTVPSAMRDHLTEGLYIGREGSVLKRIDDVLARTKEMEAELKAVQRINVPMPEGAWHIARIHAAEKEGIIDAMMAGKLLAIEKDRDEIIRVDDFSFDELQSGSDQK